MDKHFTMLQFSVLALFLSHGSSASFFTNRCGPAFEAILKQVGKTKRFEASADEKGLVGQPRQEFIARQIRLEYLRSEARTAADQERTTFDLLHEFERRLIGQAEKDQATIWKEILNDEYHTTDPQLLRPLAPHQLTTTPPNKVSVRVAAARLEARLARYRLELSQAFSELPLNQEILKQADSAIAAKVAEVERRFEKEANPEFTKRLPEEENRIALNSRMVGRARRLLADPETPEGFKKRLRDHLEFIDKYSLQPSAIFLEYVIAIEILLNP